MHVNCSNPPGRKSTNLTALFALMEDSLKISLQKPPGHFTVKGRNPDHSIAVGGPNISFATVGGPSFVSDFDNGRRSGTLEDFRNFVKVAHQLKIFHICGANVLETMEIPAESRHLDKYLSCITLHDKLWMTNMLGAYRVHDSLNMQMIVHGIDRDELIRQPLTMGNININSPRQVDESMSDALIEMAKARQPVIVTPFTLLGAMAPTTMAGSLVQQNAEALSCLAPCSNCKSRNAGGLRQFCQQC